MAKKTSKKLNAYLSLQRKVQAKLLPGRIFSFAWLRHSEETLWTIPSEVTLERFREGVLKAMEELPDFYPRDGNDLIFDYLTPGAKWMDQISIAPDASGNTAKVTCESTGFLPLSIPFAPLWNVLFCWLPFFDGGMNAKENKLILRKVNEVLGTEIKSTITRESLGKIDKKKK